MTTYQVHIKIAYSIKIDNLLDNPKFRIDSGDLSNDDQIEIFYIIKKLIFLFSITGNLMILTTF